jgi:DNA processing protein
MKIEDKIIKILFILLEQLRGEVKKSFSSEIYRAFAEKDYNVLYRLNNYFSQYPLQFEKAFESLETWSKDGILVFTYFCSEYPRRLRELDDAPLLLYVKSNNFKDIHKQCSIAIVGSRNTDSEGEKTAYTLARRLGELGVCIVSGLAVGIDTAAHTGALSVIEKDSQAHILTGAVIGSGMYNIYPKSNLKLSEKILEKGGFLISEFSPEEPPYPAHFLKRNRTIAGLSEGVLVVQAAKKSGALTTAKASLELGREVMAVPGSIYNFRYEGAHLLLQQGAHLVSNVDDILNIYPTMKQKVSHLETKKFFHNTIQEKLYMYIRKQGAVSEDALRRTFTAEDDIFSELLNMEIEGMIMKIEGNRYQVVF